MGFHIFGFIKELKQRYSVVFADTPYPVPLDLCDEHYLAAYLYGFFEFLKLKVYRLFRALFMFIAYPAFGLLTGTFHFSH